MGRGAESHAGPQMSRVRIWRVRGAVFAAGGALKARGVGMAIGRARIGGSVLASGSSFAETRGNVATGGIDAGGHVRSLNEEI